ncbi:MAG: GldG family protein [Anaerolineales bacterium]
MAKNNKNPNARYAFIGLIIALLACISTGLIGVAKGMIAAKMFTIDKLDTLNLSFQISIALVILGLAAYALLSPDSIRRFLSGRQARYGSNSLVLTVAFIGVLIATNYIVYQNPGKPWDLTEDKSNTLAKETLQALTTLPAKVTATGFYSARTSKTSAEELLQRFKTNSNGKFDYNFVDPDQNPVAARQAGVTGDGKILLTMGDQKEIASSASEKDLTSSLIRLINPSARVVYFLQGHGEATLEQSTGNNQLSLSIAKETLASKNYTVNSLNLLTDNKIPDDALAIIIAGPLKPLSAQEVTLLKKYVDAGGSLVVMADPTIISADSTSTTATEVNDPLVDYLKKDWGITLDNDVILDLDGQQPLFATSAYGGQHPITQNMNSGYVVIMPQARSIEVAQPAPDGITLTSLILTSDKSWGEMDLSGQADKVKYDEGVDILGPLTMAATGENTNTKGRVVVMGNSVFATDDYFDVYGNGNMFVNSVDWAAEQENIINITPRDTTTRTLLPIGNVSLIIIIILSIFVIPGLIIFLGISSWIARRRRG